MNKALLLLPLIMLSLLTAIWAGWLRLGWSLPTTVATAQHGALMVGSFLASLIFLERAVTFKSKWVLLLPALNATSLVFYLLGLPVAGHWCLVLGSFGFIVMCSYFVYRYRELYYYVFLGGALALFAGNILLLQTFSYPHTVSWWMVFLLFTIVAERLELSRFLALNSGKRIWLIAALVLSFFSLFIPEHWHGNTIFGASLISTALWLLKYDMARRSVKVPGQHRYSAQLLLTGYVWLLITAVLLFVKSNFIFYYDAVLHSFFIGFVFAMIFSHAPIILPAVLKWPIKIYKPVLYLWFGLLQASLLVRIVGDVLENPELRKWGGLLNGISILMFFATIVFIVQQQLQKRKGLRKA
jgi:hypothetical protein